jgi:hypothetical protein
MKALLVHPGASWSVADVWQGVHDALQRAGVEVIEYALDGRIEVAYGYLHGAYAQLKDKSKTPEPTHADMLWWASEGMVTRALWFECDVILVIACGWLHPLVFKMTRRAGIPVAVLFTESPNEDAFQLQVAALIDVCWTNERTSLDAFRAVCPNAHYWRHAIDPAHHKPTADDGLDVPAHDVVFVGTGWAERVALLEAIDWTGVDLGLYGSWDLISDDSPLKPYIKGGITPNGYTAALYRRAKIGINLHRTSTTYTLDSKPITHAESMNPRCYELAATGCFYLSDARAEVSEKFGGCVPTFRDAQELQGLIRYYLRHDDDRRQIAAALPAYVAGDTFDARVSAMLTVLEGV